MFSGGPRATGSLLIAIRISPSWYGKARITVSEGLPNHERKSRRGQNFTNHS